jgi:hypothetical protein
VPQAKFLGFYWNREYSPDPSLLIPIPSMTALHYPLVIMNIPSGISPDLTNDSPRL